MRIFIFTISLIFSVLLSSGLEKAVSYKAISFQKHMKKQEQRNKYFIIGLFVLAAGISLNSYRNRKNSREIVKIKKRHSKEDEINERQRIMLNKSKQENKKKWEHKYGTDFF
jgi:hypothetical protein